MKRVMQLGIVSLALIALCGCSVVSRQEGKNITLSAEHEALCNSKNTLNKKLCRRTMGQLPKFENDVNTYFKEKFGIGDFVLAGIHFPYGSFEHGGFNATFQLKSDRYVMMTDTFDYKDGKYMIRARGESIAGKQLLASAILVSEYLKTLPIDQIEKDLETMGITTNKENRLYYYYDSGRYFSNKNLISSSDVSVLLEKDEQSNVIEAYRESKEIAILEKYKAELTKSLRFFALTYSQNKEDLKRLFDKYIEYRKKHPEYGVLLDPRIQYYENALDVNEKDISMYIEGEIVMSTESKNQ